MSKGTVKWFNDAKGFGFIESAEGDIFVHYSVIESGGFKTLKDGEEVEYEVEKGDKGLHAKKVIRVSPPPERGAPERGASERDPSQQQGAAPTQRAVQAANGLASQIEVERVSSEGEGLESEESPPPGATTISDQKVSK